MKQIAVIGPKGPGVIDVSGNTKCAKCGELLDDTREGLPERIPCPKCGSTNREISVVMTEAVNVTDSFVAKIVRGALVLQTVVVRGAFTDEGAIIQAVAAPWFDIVHLIERDPATVHEIPARKWEEIIAGAYKKAGFDVVILTPQSGDRGRDVIATKHGLGSVRVIDQVKAFKPGHLVGANDVRALMGVLQTDGAAKGFLTTTSDFAPLLPEDPLIKPLIPSRLELVNGTRLLARLKELARSKVE